ncbi:PREDICTED: protein phosphatase 1 regulatory subunit pprA-like [Polistes dominula]|uniref:Protein phosphatase 1 regulatory subunit pprA-like n=1 Tax=Polistes dominula TaxID=743375 RepID=A0ABM1IH01_POLDO|nr:PREDICTED: protein phosphatase 1 regulatory subunit pprA-like [Polistes dominula]
MGLRAVSAIFYSLYLLALFAVGSSTPQNYYEGVADMLNTTGPKTNEYILHKDCKRFDISLNFSDTLIETLGKDFISTQFITSLNFSGNTIKSIASGAFDSLPALESLNLAGNRLQNLFSFNGHNNLKVLILANQSEIGYWNNLIIFGEYPELRYLDLSGNKINSINMPQNYHNIVNHLIKKYLFPKLKYLDLSYNFLNNFDYSHLFSHNLTNLNLIHNNLYNVDLRIFINLVELRLNYNSFEKIRNYCYDNTACIDQMPKLKYFSISHNSLSTIDEDIFFKMPNLVTVDLSNNALTGVFTVLNYELASLQNVYLDNNGLSSISMVYHLANLTILSVAHNKLQEIKPNFVNAPILKKLYLNNNEIRIIDENAFSNLKYLEVLDLNSNTLDKLPIRWSDDFKNLRYLNLSNNNFKTLESLSLSQCLTNIKIDLLNIQLTHTKTEFLRNLPENATIYFIPHSENNI